MTSYEVVTIIITVFFSILTVIFSIIAIFNQKKSKEYKELSKSYYDYLKDKLYNEQIYSQDKKKIKDFIFNDLTKTLTFQDIMDLFNNDNSKLPIVKKILREMESENIIKIIDITEFDSLIPQWIIDPRS